MAEKIRTFTEEATIDDIMTQVNELLDESIATKGYVIHATETTSLIDLSQIDFDALKAHFDKGRKRTEAEKLKKAIGDKLLNMVQLNKTRTDLMEKSKKLIDEYNKGMDVNGFFAKLVLDWRKRQKTRADVYSTVKTILDELPRAYTPEIYQQKCDTVYQHVYDSYQGEGMGVYSESGKVASA